MSRAAGIPAMFTAGRTSSTTGTPPADISHTLGQFLIGWDAAIFMLFLVTLLLPLIYSLILGAGAWA